MGKDLVILWIITQDCSSPFCSFGGESLKFEDLQTFNISLIGDVLQRPSGPQTWNIFDSYLKNILLAIEWEWKLQADGSEKLWQYSVDTQDRYCWYSWRLVAVPTPVHLLLNRYMGVLIFDRVKISTHHSIWKGPNTNSGKGMNYKNKHVVIYPLNNYSISHELLR